MMDTGVFTMHIQLSKKKNGFTLIELLVVMTIIAIIATLGITAYLNAMRNARNAKNISNLNAMQSAFEQYYGVNGSYDADAGSTVASTCSTMGSSIQGGLPVSASTTAYQGSCTATSYCVCADLEGTTTDVQGGNANGLCSSWQTDTIGTYYCVANKQ